ncbi:MAG: hypothetical protein AAF383_12130 [Cyanobacteria bacterium P01_A01_bin.83]
MLEVGWYSTKLLLKGKLIRNRGYFYKQIAIGSILGLLLLVGMGETGLNPLIAIVFSSLALGMAMPFLLKDVKMQ